MSFLARITQRAMGVATGAPVLRPKDRGVAHVEQPSTAAPETAGDELEERPELQEEETQAAHRAAAAEPEEAAADTPEELPVRRETTDSASWIDEDPEIATTEGTVAHRDATDETAELGDQVEVQPAIRAIRPPSTDPVRQDDEPKPEVTAGEAEPPPARMARRAGAAPGSTSGLAPAVPAGDATADTAFATETWPAPIAAGVAAGVAVGSDTPSGVSFPLQHHHHHHNHHQKQHQQPVPVAGADGLERPQIFIDQVDVLIHEPAAPPQPQIESTARTRSRFVAARYLRRL